MKTSLPHLAPVLLALALMTPAQHARPQEPTDADANRAIADLETKTREEHIQPEASAIVYNIDAWHRQPFNQTDKITLVDEPVGSIRAAAETLGYFLHKGIFPLSWGNKPPQFKVLFVDDAQRSPYDPLHNEYMWDVLGISVSLCGTAADAAKRAQERMPDVIVAADTLPAAVVAVIRTQLRNVPIVTMSIPVAPPVAAKPATLGVRDHDTPATIVYRGQWDRFERAVWDAVQQGVPGGQLVYVSLMATK